MRNSISVRHQPNCVFIWIPKTAGTSLFRLLEGVGCQKYKTVEDISLAFPQAGIATFGHVHYGALVDAGLVTTAYDRSAFKFCVVRHPLDRAISLYEHNRRHGALPENCSFPVFARLLNDGSVGSVGLFNNDPRRLTNCNPQTVWVQRGDGSSLVDHVAKFEDMPDLLAVLSRRLGVRDSLPHHRRSEREDFGRYYTDRRTRTLVEEHFRSDFESFGYE